MAKTFVGWQRINGWTCIDSFKPTGSRLYNSEIYCLYVPKLVIKRGNKKLRIVIDYSFLKMGRYEYSKLGDVPHLINDTAPDYRAKKPV